MLSQLSFMNSFLNKMINKNVTMKPQKHAKQNLYDFSLAT